MNKKSAIDLDKVQSPALRSYLNRQRLSEACSENILIIDLQKKYQDKLMSLKDDFSIDIMDNLISVAERTEEVGYVAALATMKTIAKAMPDRISNEEGCKRITALYEARPDLAKNYQSRIEAMNAYAFLKDEKHKDLMHDLQVEYPNDGDLDYRIAMVHQSNGNLKEATQHLHSAFSAKKHYNLDAGLEILRLYSKSGESPEMVSKHAKLLVLAAQKDGAEFIHNSKSAKILIEASITGGLNVNENVLKNAMCVIASNPDLEVAKKDLEELKNLKENKKHTIENVLSNCDAILTLRSKKLELDNSIKGYDSDFKKQNISEQDAKTLKLAAAQEAKSIDASITDLLNEEFKLMRHGISFRGSFQEGKVISGNMKFGGPIPDTIVNKADFDEMKSFLQVPFKELFEKYHEKLPDNISPTQCLGDIEDPQKFLNMAQTIVRTNFKTDAKNLEIIDHSDHEKHFDTLKKVQHKTQGFEHDWNAEVKRGQLCNGNSCTSEVANGIGDCRHHAAFQQLLYDSWSELRLNRSIEGVQEGREGSHEKFEKDNGNKFMILDTSFHIPVSGKMYRPERPLIDGKPDMTKFIASPDGVSQKVEDHTTNLFISSDGAIKLQDSFYNKTYKMSNCDVKVGVNKDGVVEISGVELENVQLSDGKTIGRLPVKITNAPYSRSVEVSTIDPNTHLLWNSKDPLNMSKRIEGSRDTIEHITGISPGSITTTNVSMLNSVVKAIASNTRIKPEIGQNSNKHKTEDRVRGI